MSSSAFVTEIPSQDRSWATACHLVPLAGYLLTIPGAGILCPLLIWLCRRDESVFVDEQGREAVNFQIMMALLFLGCWLLVPLLGLGFLLMIAVNIIGAVFAILAAVKTASGKPYAYPVHVDLVNADSFRS
jgi:uncharacterized Tic20 family protein